MIENIIKFCPRQKDLYKYKEFWSCDSFNSRKGKILDYIFLTKGSVPSRNMKFIREGIIDVPDRISIDDLLNMTIRIRKECVIDCFQISIDRRQKKAHLLFDWYDRKENKCVNIYEALQYHLSVLIARELDIILPDNLDGIWLRHYLCREYKDNPMVYQEILDRMKHMSLGKRHYQILKKAISYVEKICKEKQRI